jgi:hypothetical protein
MTSQKGWKRTYLNWVSTVVVGNGVPNGVEVRSTANAWKIFFVATGIT